MQLTTDKIVALVKSAIDIRNQCKEAIAAKDHIIDIPAVPGSGENPGKPASQKSTGTLANMANYSYTLATQGIAWLRTVGGEAAQASVNELEKALNSPAPAAAATMKTPATPPAAK